MTMRELAIRIDADPASPAVARMIECGLHSGFPACCVAFFVKIWWPWATTIDALSVRRRADALIAYDSYQQWTKQAGYVPCPRCALERKFVEVLPCDCASRGSSPRRSR
jgi:hypothetical protein